MPTKGTYAAYQQQPQLPSGTFAGESQIARIAQRNIEKRRLEQAKQEKLLNDYQTAFGNAEAMSEVNPMEYSDKLQGLLFNVTEAYKEDLDNAQKVVSGNPTTENVRKVKQIQARFDNNLATLKGIGNGMNYLVANEAKLDPLLNMGIYNGNTKFLQQLPSMLDKVDPRTLTVDGKNVASIYSEMVPLGSLVPKVDDVTFFNGLADEYIGEVTEVEYRNERTDKYEKKKEANNYIGSDEARSRFFAESDGSIQREKLVAGMIQAYANISDEESLVKFASDYGVLDDKGKLFITDQGAWNYFNDKYLKPKLSNITASGTVTQKPKEPSASDLDYYRKLQKEKENDFTKLNAINDFLTGKMGEIGISGKSIRVGGEEGTVVRAGYIYDPITGKTENKIEYKFSDPIDQSRRRRIGVREVTLGEYPEQELGRYLYDMDFRTTKAKYKDYVYDIPENQRDKPTLNTRGRQVDQLIEQNIDVLSEELGAVSTAEDFIKYFNNKVTDFSYLGSTTLSILRDKLDEKKDDEVEFGKGTYSLKNHRKELFRKIALMSLAEKQLANKKTEGNAITKKLNTILAQENPEYYLDPVERWIREDKSREAKRGMANDLLAEDKYTDAEIIDRLSKTDMSPKKAPHGNIVEQDGIEYKWNGYEYVENK